MRLLFLISTLVIGAMPAHAALYSSTPNALIPDNNPNGYVNTISVSGLGPQLDSVSVSLNISGGYNGDLFVYLSYNGQLLTLLNRVGTPGNPNGYSDTGFNVTLSDSGTAGLHNYQDNGAQFNGNGQLTGTWQPDSSGPTFQSKFQGVNPNGDWSIFVADLSGGDQSTLVSWGLDITAVPEPVTVALSLFAGMSVVAGGYRALRLRASRRKAARRLRNGLCE